MTNITIQEPQAHADELVDRAARGEVFMVLRDGEGVAHLRALSRAPMTAEAMLARYRLLPAVDPVSLRADLDRLLNPRI